MPLMNSLQNKMIQRLAELLVESQFRESRRQSRNEPKRLKPGGPIPSDQACLNLDLFAFCVACCAGLDSRPRFIAWSGESAETRPAIVPFTAARF
jgi:hypothetical protein